MRKKETTTTINKNRNNNNKKKERERKQQLQQQQQPTTNGRKVQQDMPRLASQGLGRRNGCLGGWIVQLWTKEGQEGFLRRAAHVGRVCVLCVCVCVSVCVSV